MENQHLTYFKVENFKKFDSLEVKDIGQFNLIVGDNNVGKTCLLEALLFDENPQQLLINFWIALKKRGMIFQIEEITKKVGNISTTEIINPKQNYFKEYIFGNFPNSHSSKNYLVIDLSFKIIEISIAESNQNNKEFESDFININSELINIYDYNEDYINFPLINFNNDFHGLEIKELFEAIKTKVEKEYLINALKTINSKLTNIDFRGEYNDLKNVFLFSFEDQDEFIPLNYLGDGFKRIFYITLKSIFLKNKRLLIDEIEIGIHHSKQKDFWLNILKICKELNVQLFATTHSKECEIAFMNALNDLQDDKEYSFKNNAREINLYNNANGNVSSSTLKFENFSTALKANIETRN